MERGKVTLPQGIKKGPGTKSGPQVAVIGGSASGFFTASLLARAGCAVDVLERSDQLDPTPRTLIVTSHMRTLLGRVGEIVVQNVFSRLFFPLLFLFFLGHLYALFCAPSSHLYESHTTPHQPPHPSLIHHSYPILKVSSRVLSHHDVHTCSALSPTIVVPNLLSNKKYYQVRMSVQVTA